MQKKTLIFIFLSGLASFFNYATYPVLARILSDAQFVSITVALALFTQISSFTLAIVALTIGISKQDSKNSAIVIEKLQAVLSHLFIVFLIIFLITSPLFFRRISLSPAMLAPIVIMLGLSLITSVISGYLNGKGKLIKLGLALVLTAILQLALSVIVSMLTRSGTLTLYAMSAGTVLALSIIYIAYHGESLPQLVTIFTHRLSIYKSSSLRALLKYIIATSIAILVINILLILDLLVINNRQRDAKMYADIYVISRVVYFGGTLFIWPFLSNIQLTALRRNVGLFARVAAVFIVITGGSLLALVLFGEQITQLLFGGDSASWDSAKNLALLAIVYKFNFLIISTLVMYFIVVRSYLAVWFSMLTAICLGAYTLASSPNTASVLFVRDLSVISFGLCLAGLVLFYASAQKGSAK